MFLNQNPLKWKTTQHIIRDFYIFVFKIRLLSCFSVQLTLQNKNGQLIFNPLLRK